MGAAAAERAAQLAQVDSPVRDLVLFTQKYTNTPPLGPGPFDSNIATLAARVLQQTHYTRHALNDEMAGKFLHRYLELLDGAHFHFLQGDLKEFEHYRTTLDDLTLRQGDLSPAHVMFRRFLQRVEQRVEFVAGLLEANQFEFNGEDRYIANRKDMDWPADLAAAKDLWRQHLRYEYLTEKLNKQKPEETLKTLANRYKRLLRSLHELDADDVLQFYLTALTQAYDPHSDYMGKAQLENFAISMKLSLFGIGAVLQSEDGYCKIKELMAGGPAVKSKKLKPNDRIVAVQQAGQEPVDVVDMKLTKVVEMIRGPKATQVTLTVIPADAADSSVRKSVTLVRDEIKLEDQEAKARIIDLPDVDGKPARVGVIDLPSFYATFDVGKQRGKSEPRSTTADVARLLKKLVEEKVIGVVLDLRRNGGGSLEEAIRLTGAFIKEGPVVQVRDASNELNVESDPDPAVLYDGPLVVLTSRFSASASEILAAALQDYGRAVVIGDASTHGKGTVQTIYELDKLTRFRFPTNVNPGALKVTIRKFYRVNGASTQLKGVTPDIILPSVNNYRDVGEPSQEFALEWDTIPSAKFDQLDRVRPYLADLRRLSVARQEKDKEFAYVREDIELYRKALADKSVSLNEATRLAEKKEVETRIKARKQERLARTDPRPTTYEISLKQTSQPGLPAPLARTNDLAKAEVHAEIKGVEVNGGEPEEESPLVDAHLDETKRILLDYITLLTHSPKGPAITINN